MPSVSQPVEARLWSRMKPDPVSGCWNWQGSRVGGYGSILVGSRTDGTRRSGRVHRIAWEVTNGPVPKGMGVLHKCDNKACANPDHLYVGTHSQNMKDAWDRGLKRPHNQSGELNTQAKLTCEQIAEIRTSSDGASRLASRYGISPSTVSQIRHRKRWRHVA